MGTQRKTKARMAALAAAISLALSGTAFALPTGGVIADGSVTVTPSAYERDSITLGPGRSIGGVDSFFLNRDTIINWQDFSLGTGEQLIINLENHSLLNRVVSDRTSEIDGSLSALRGNFFLVNPNGIVIGPNAGISPGDTFVLSTLALTDDAFRDFANGGAATFTTPEGRSVAAPLTLQGGNTSGTAQPGAMIHGGDTLVFLGGTVEIADGVSISPTDERDSLIEIAAAKDLTLWNVYNNPHERVGYISSDPANNVRVSGMVMGDGLGGHDSRIHIDGGTIDLVNASIQPMENSSAYITAGEDGIRTTSNVINVTNSYLLYGKEIVLTGGRVNVSGGSLSQNTRIVQDGSITPTPTPTPTPTLDIDDANAYQMGMTSVIEVVAATEDNDLRASNLALLVRMLDDNTSISDRSKAAAVSGMLRAIDQLGGLSAEDRAALGYTVVGAFEGTNARERTTENATSAAITLSNGAVYPDMAAAREAILTDWQKDASPVEVQG